MVSDRNVCVRGGVLCWAALAMTINLIGERPKKGALAKLDQAAR